MRARCPGRHSAWLFGVVGVGLLVAGCSSGQGAAARERRARTIGEAIRAKTRGPAQALEFLADEALEGGAGAIEPDPCCAPSGSPGCADPRIEGCVCAEDPGCCEGAWDGLCVLEVDALGCGACGSTTVGNSCCDVHGAGGCAETSVSACVCAHDPGCCAGAWDELCVAEVDRLGCGTCGGGGSQELCCLPHGGPGCVDPGVAACVCEQNPYCCEEDWDEACVAAVDALGCGVCAGDDGCCGAHEGPGCDAPAVERCVCEVAPACCSGAWDETCVGLVELLRCGACDPPSPAACCSAHEAAGCDEVVVEACVCAELPGCCRGPWTDVCAAAVVGLGCGICDDVRGCCLSHETGGCDGEAIEACVCAEDPYCCSETWDDACVAAVEGLGCGRCDDEAPLCGELPGGCAV